jgi:hypothetical protein
LVELTRSSYLLYRSRSQEGDLGGEGQRILLIVRHIDHRDLQGAVKLLELLPDLLSEASVEV